MSYRGSSASLASGASGISDRRFLRNCFCKIDPMKLSGRRTQTLQLVILPLIPSFVFLLYTLIGVSMWTTDWLRLDKVSEGFDFGREILSVVTSLQTERLALLSSALSFRYNLTFEEASQQANAAILGLSKWPSGFREPYLQSGNSLLNYLSAHRANFKDDMKTQGTTVYGQIIASLVSWIPIGHDLEETDHVFYDYLFAYRRLIASWEAFELHRILGLKQLSFGNLSTREDSYYIGNISLVQNLYHESFLYNAHLNGVVPTQSRLAKMTSSHHVTLDQFNQLCDDFVTALQNIEVQITHDVSANSIFPTQIRVGGRIALCVFFIVALVPVIALVLSNATHTTNSIYAIVTTFTSRVVELQKEKRKTEQILAQMLPRSVAKQLQLGYDIRAEQFAVSTIYFSDIADFTEISHESQPMQVVTLLNNVYNFLDGKIELYDVYKVETVGCVYMTVSGVPMRNRDRHADEIAMMSLDIIEATEDFMIPHMPGRGLQLRVGAHTGEV